MNSKEYYREIAEEIRLILFSRALISKDRIQVVRTKKSPNIISICVNQRPQAKIQMIKNGKFTIQRVSPFLSREASKPVSFYHKEDLLDFIIKEFV